LFEWKTEDNIAHYQCSQNCAQKLRHTSKELSIYRYVDVDMGNIVDF